MDRRTMLAPALLLISSCSGGSSQPSSAGDSSAADAFDSAGPVDAPSDVASSNDASDGSSAEVGGSADPLDPSKQPVVDTDPSHYPANIWVTDGLAKVQASDAPTAVHWALVSAAKNEFESFQVHLRPSSAIAALNVTVSDLTNGVDSSQTVAASNIVVSREAYLNVTTKSDANGVTGAVPDALIPAKDPMFGETRNAFPFAIAAGATQSVWIDVFVPAATASGYYVGAVTVSDGTTVLAKLPIRLKVWDFALPSTATLKSAFGMSWNGACVQGYGGYASCGAAVPSGDPDDATEYFHSLYARFFLDHRVTVSDVIYAGPSGSDWTHFDSLYGPLLDGTAPTRLVGAKLTDIRYSGSTTDTAEMTNWVSHFKSKSWLAKLFFYDCDEPASGNSCTFADALAEENRAHSVSTEFQTLLTADIEDITGHGLLDSVDILTPVVDQMWPRGGTNQRPTYDTFLAKAGKQLYWYQSCDEHESCGSGSPGGAESTWPSYMADASPIRNRIFQWMAHLYRISGELYYASDLCFADSSCTGMNPWKSIYVFGGNGDGTLIYPGTKKQIGGTHDIPISSIRMELIRDGMEDYEFLHLLDTNGQTAFADSESSFITSPTTFTTDPSKLTTAREAIGDKLHALALTQK